MIAASKDLRLLTAPLVVLVFAPVLFGQRASLETARKLFAAGSYEKAATELREVIRLEPSNADAHLLLGNALGILGKRSESIEQLLDAARLKPDSPIVYYQLGVTLSHFSELAAARSAFEKAISLDRNFSKAHVNLALLLAQTGDLSAADEEFDRALQIKDPSGDAALLHYLRAKLYNNENDFANAIRHLKLALKLRPGFADAWSELGIAERAALDDTEALKAFERAVALSPADPDSQYRLGAQDLKAGKIKEAVAHLAEADRLRPGDRATLYNLQRALRKDGRIPDADRVLAMVDELVTKSKKTSQDSLAAVQLNNAGVELEKKGDLIAALEKYRAAEELNPAHEGFHLNHGLALCRLGRWQEGIAEIREVTQENPANTEAAKALYIAVDQFASLEKMRRTSAAIPH